VPSGSVELLSEVGSAASKGASTSPGAARAARGARSSGASMERILGIWECARGPIEVEKRALLR
jgi:hypothetical protein